MEALIIKKTDETPAVIFNPEKGKFQIAGNAWPENAQKFFEKIFEWLEDYFIDPLDETVLELRLNYFNTAVAKQLVKLLLLFKEKSEIHNVKIIWYYPKDDYATFMEAQRYKQLLDMGDILEVKEIKTPNPTE